MAGGRAALISATRIVPVTLTLDTNIYASGDVLADTQPVLGASRASGEAAMLSSIVVVDEDDQGVEMDLVFFDANVALGTENATPSISDANVRNFLGIVNIPAASYVDLGGAKVATLRNVALILKAVDGSRDIYVAAVTRGTPTYTAAGLKLRFGFI